MSFAMQEAVIALACLLRRRRYDYAGTSPPQPVMKITIQPEHGLEMRLSARPAGRLRQRCHKYLHRAWYLHETVNMTTLGDIVNWVRPTRWGSGS